MCVNYAPARPSACHEEDAIEVSDKTSANFCDYFKPNPNAFDGGALVAEREARTQLDSLFGADVDSAADKAADANASSNLQDADSLFKS